MDISEIRSKILEYKSKGMRMFTSSSFQTHSIALLHILSEIDRSIPVYFLNTGYHFPETVAYRDQIGGLLGLNLVELYPETPKSMQKDSEGRLFFTSDPDYCCFLNKTQPMEKVMLEHDVWINGVRAQQSAVRQAMKVEQPAKHGILRFHPMLDWDSRRVYEYLAQHNLPSHPLDNEGYLSIGCEPCTRKLTPDMMEREARWYGLKKTECGLNTDLVAN